MCMWVEGIACSLQFSMLHTVGLNSVLTMSANLEERELGGNFDLTLKGTELSGKLSEFPWCRGDLPSHFTFSHSAGSLLSLMFPWTSSMSTQVRSSLIKKARVKAARANKLVLYLVSVCLCHVGGQSRCTKTCVLMIRESC